MRRIVIVGHLVALLIIGGLILWSPTGATWADQTRNLSDRILTLELRLDELQSRMTWLIGLIGADVLGTLALLRKANV